MSAREDEQLHLGLSERGLRAPDRNIAFINQDDVDQARKYLGDFNGGLLLVVNNERLVAKYTKLFEDEGLSGFRVVFIPSKEE